MPIKLFNITIYIKKEIIAVIVVFMFMLTALAGYLICKSEDDVVIDARDLQNADTSIHKDMDNKKESVETEEIKVYIIGCVNNPGIVTLKKGQMIYEAIEAAGGATKEADIENINMVYKLEENVMLNILPKDRAFASEKGQSNPGGEKSTDAGGGIQIIRDEGDSLLIYTGGTQGKENSLAALAEKININTASIAELDTLPGIGKVTAESIIKYRQQYGKFKKIDDIMKVPGIKESKFEKIKDFITVE